MIDTARLIRAAQVWYDAGCCVIPAKADGTKRPFGNWTEYQQQRPTWQQIEQWLNSGQYDGFGIICGQVSGGLEMFEIEGRAADLYDPLGMRMIEHGYADLWHRLCTGYREKTPSGGFHWLLRVDQPRHNLKLARRPATTDELIDKPDETIKVLIETRGEGGFTIVAPSGGRTHPDGLNWQRVEGAPARIPVITVEERDALHAIAATFDQLPTDDPAPPRSSSTRDPLDGLRPGDDYNQRANWADILTGWTYTGQLGGAATWRRPGKNIGISATTGRNDGDNLYVFSTSTPFDTEKPYSKFAAYTLLEHSGDWAAAARALRRNGYGQQRDRGDDHTTSAGSGSAEAPPAEPAGAGPVDDQAEEAFWNSRPVLVHIREHARARRASPYAVLGCVLARIITATPPFIVLPGLIGSYGSLNLFVALVGPSGGGKGAAESAAADCLVMPDIDSATVGSGEGIGHLYAHREKGEIVRDRDAVLFTVPEVDNLVALAGRQGATLLPQLRSAWSGEQLGFAYADKNKALPIGRHTYRMGLILGVQPGRAAALLDDADGGTPQRFLWMPTSDLGAPEQAPDAPEPWIWELPRPGIADMNGLVSLPIPDIARNTIARNRLAKLHEKGEDLDGHALLTRLKTAAALALLDERQQITEQDWELSGHILDISSRTRGNVVNYLAGKARTANRAKGEAEGTRALVVEQVISEAGIKRVARKVMSHLVPIGQSARSELRRKVAHRDRVHFEDALERLVEAGQIKIEQAVHGEIIKAL